MNRNSMCCVLLLAITPACNPEDDPTASETTDAETEADPTAPDPTAPDPTAPDPTDASADDSSTGGGAEGGTDDSGKDTSSAESGDDTGTTGGVEPVDPADLPFGGYVSWTVQGLFGYGFADFYEIEYPEDPAYIAWNWELPLEGPLDEDTWTIVATQPPPMPSAEATITDLDPGAAFVVEGGELSLPYAYGVEAGTWNVAPVDFTEVYGGDPWSIEFEGGADFPAESFADVMPGVPGDASEFEWVLDAAGAPVGLTWHAQEAHGVTGFFGVANLAGQFLPLCFADLEDDGETDLPAECGADPVFPVDPNIFPLYVAILGQEFHDDIAYGEHRVRIVSAVNTQLDLDLPFAP